MDENQNFTQEIDEYIVLKLRLEDYTGTNRSLPEEFTLMRNSPTAEAALRVDEERLLKQYFRYWQSPFHRQMKGWRADTPIFILYKGQLAGGVYLCDKNQFDDDPSWGQLHYAFLDPQFKGQGIYSVIFREAVGRAHTWGLQGLYLNSDRYMLPEVYERWGAVFWRKIQKQKRSLKGSLLSRCKYLVNWVVKHFRS